MGQNSDAAVNHHQQGHHTANINYYLHFKFANYKGRSSALIVPQWGNLNITQHYQFNTQMFEVRIIIPTDLKLCPMSFIYIYMPRRKLV